MMTTDGAPEDFARVLGGRFRQARLAAKLTQEDVAGHLNRSRQAVSLWETGNAQPTLKEFRDLLVLYGVSCDRLMFGSDDIEDAGKRVLDRVKTATAAVALGR